MTHWQEKRTQLIDDGYCICEQVLTPEMLERVRLASPFRLIGENRNSSSSTLWMRMVNNLPLFRQ